MTNHVLQRDASPFALSRWWAYVLRGVVAIVLGVGLAAFPGLTLSVMISFFGAFAIVDGIVAIVAAFSPHGRFRTLGLFGGIVGILAGAAALLYPGLTFLLLTMLIAARALVVGFVEIGTAFGLRKDVEGEWLLGLTGALSVVFGALLLFRPVAGMVALIGILSLYAIFVGFVLIALGVEARSLSRRGVGASRRDVVHAHGI